MTNKKAAEQIAAKDEVATQITIDLSPPSFFHVRVTSEAGVFKNGQQYDQGAELVMELRAAQRFEANGEVEILEEAEGYSPEVAAENGGQNE